jgi:hypothetical protein
MPRLTSEPITLCACSLSRVTYFVQQDGYLLGSSVYTIKSCTSGVIILCYELVVTFHFMCSRGVQRFHLLLSPTYLLQSMRAARHRFFSARDGNIHRIELSTVLPIHYTYHACMQIWLAAVPDLKCANKSCHACIDPLDTYVFYLLVIYKHECMYIYLHSCFDVQSAAR